MLPGTTCISNLVVTPLIHDHVRRRSLRAHSQDVHLRDCSTRKIAQPSQLFAEAINGFRPWPSAMFTSTPASIIVVGAKSIAVLGSEPSVKFFFDLIASRRIAESSPAVSLM